MRIAWAALAWGAVMGAASFYGGFVGPVFGAGVALGLAGAFAARRRLGIFLGWSRRDFSSALTLAAVVGAVFWASYFIVFARASARAFVAYNAALAAYVLIYGLRSSKRSRASDEEPRSLG